MSILSKINQKANSIALEYYERLPQTTTEKLKVYALLLLSIFNGILRLLNAKYRLRNCQVGKMVTVKGNLKVNARGKIIIGNNCKIWSHLGITQISAGPRATISIGQNTFINTGTIITARSLIQIGQNCQIANQVILMDNDFHGVDSRDVAPTKEAIIIGDNVWLATRVIVLKGVTIGDGCVIAAGAVVTKDIPPYSLAGGVPCKIIRNIQKQTP